MNTHSILNNFLSLKGRSAALKLLLLWVLRRIKHLMNLWYQPYFAYC